MTRDEKVSRLTRSLTPHVHMHARKTCTHAERATLTRTHNEHTHTCRRATLTRTHALTNTRTYAHMHATLKRTLAHTTHDARHMLNLYVHAPFVKEMDCYGY